ncbi:hypothetical protein CPB84DRAFT_1776836 [Gymnopilus junonius]|uniref:F-box domain-containing protein n=1 Tax=Gymnopilus junonius TaxID=109634 RepID=A0A9P5NPC6_GYMJU|nr:hypothetical protein CPB84DRAFT_1776836 [Gymnopilus junonius]
MQKTSIADTPTEVLERIIDFLHDDLAALCSSSLASRRWVSGARYHLFGQIVLHDFQRTANYYRDNVHPFLLLVQSPYSTILLSVRKVVLDISTLDLIPNVVDALKDLVFLRTMALVDFSYSSKTPALCWIAKALPDIEELSYNKTNVVHDEAYRFFASFDRLKSLSIYTEPGTVFSFSTNIPGLHFTHLRTLRLRLLDSEQFIGWLQGLAEFHPILETLDIRLFRLSHTGWGPIRTLNTFLKAISDSLQHLSVGIDYVAEVADVDQSLCFDPEGTPVDLSTLSELRTLFFKTHNVNAICDSLATLHPSSKLEVLNLHVPRWKYAIWRISNTKCSCVPSQMLERLNRIITVNQSFADTALNLRISRSFTSSDSGFMSVSGLLETMTQKAGFKLSLVDYSDEEDYQIDFAGTLYD